jgi:peptide-methionine (S)-S-oxide reductase
MSTHQEKITLAGGCFWCIEGAYNQLRGIHSAVSGYMGGNAALATYQDVCSGKSGHAEVVQLTFDNNIISCREILEIFFTLHDASQLNRQGNDIGSQYRSGVFYHDDRQKDIALDIIAEINESDIYATEVVTEITAHSRFFSGEEYHQDYVNNNPESQYCQAVVSPKLAKFRKTFVDKLKSTEN